MTVIKLTGNTLTLNSTPSVVPLSNSYAANSTQGASCVYIYNPQTTNTLLTIANSQGNNTFNLPPSTTIILQKQPADTITASANCIGNPIQKTPD